MSQITLVGTRLATTGETFVYSGATPGCEGCPYREQCLNLSEGVKYRITSVRDGGQTLDCAVHLDGVVAVEVEPATVTANVPTKGAYAGTSATLAGPCSHTECPSHERCVPLGAEFDTEYRIETVEGEPPHDHCALDRSLTSVTFEPAEE